MSAASSRSGIEPGEALRLNGPEPEGALVALHTDDSEHRGVLVPRAPQTAEFQNSTAD